MPKQFKRDNELNEKRLTTFIGFVMILSLVIIILMCLLSYLSVKPFHYFWTYFNFLTMLVHIGLIVSPVPAQIHDMMTQLFPWVSLTGISSIEYLNSSLSVDFSAAPPYSSAFW